MKRCKLFALLLAAALLLTGCGSRKSPAAEPMAYGVNMAQDKSADYDVPYAYEEPTEEAATTAPAPEGAAGIADAENRYGEKIIYNAELTITADVPADSLENARRQCEALGGYLASSSCTSSSFHIASKYLLNLGLSRQLIGFLFSISKSIV